MITKSQKLLKFLTFLVEALGIVDVVGGPVLRIFFINLDSMFNNIVTLKNIALFPKMMVNVKL